MSQESTSAPEVQVESKSIDLSEAFRASWKLLLITGIIVTLLGIFALLAPLLASLAIELIVATCLVVGGVFQLVYSFRLSDRGNAFFSGLGGAVSLILGLLFLSKPIVGLFTLTFVLSVFFIADGIVRVSWSRKFRELPMSRWMLWNGITSCILGLVVAFALPTGALWILGILFGVQMFFSGTCLVALSFSLKKIAKPSSTVQ